MGRVTAATAAERWREARRRRGARWRVWCRRVARTPEWRTELREVASYFVDAIVVERSRSREICQASAEIDTAKPPQGSLALCGL